MADYSGTVIAGCAEIPYQRRRPGGSTLSLLAAAFQRAIAHAGIAHADVDGLAVASFTLPPDHAIDVAWQLGLKLRWCMDDALGGASGIDMLQHAARAIQAGDASTVVILSADHFEADDFKRLVDNYNRTTRDRLAPLGFGGPNALFALVTQQYAARHALNRPNFAAICIAQRAWASRNPGAVYRSELTLEAYMAAPLVADPLCRFDCVPVVSGANAIVLRAGDHGIAIKALGACYNPTQQEGDGWRTGLPELAPALWRDAGVGPEAMDVVSVYDDYPVMVLSQLHDLGFTGPDLARLHRRPPPPPGLEHLRRPTLRRPGGRGGRDARVGRGNHATASGSRRPPSARSPARRGRRLRHGAVSLRHVRQRRRARFMMIYACSACGYTVFPARLLCHRCGGGTWTEMPCDRGMVAAVTALLAEVRTPQDVRLIVRLQRAAAPGASVTLHEAEDGALWGTPEC